MVKKKNAPKKKKLSIARRIVTPKTKKKTVKKIIARRKKKILAIPKGYHSITPYIIVSNAVKAIDFYKKAFGAKEAMRLEKPDGKIGHAELKIGDSKIMLADECAEMNARSAKEFDATMSLHFYTKSVDEVVTKAVSLGATLIRPIEDMFYGDRCGLLEDPFGHRWHIATHIENVSPAKLKKRMAALCAK